MTRRCSAAAFVLLILTAIGGCAKVEPVERHTSRPLMGTIVDVTARGESAAAVDAAIDAAYREMGRLSDMMNHYDPNSVVSRINREAGARPVPVPPELLDVLQQSLAVSERTDGAFDMTVGSLRGWDFRPQSPRIPAAQEIAEDLGKVGYRNLRLDTAQSTAYLAHSGTRIDLGGIAKLPILEAGLRRLRDSGVDSALINGGGDIVASGNAGGRPWRVGVRDPDAPDRMRWTLDVGSGFVSSSGDYERYFMLDGRRYHHILDPRTGYPTSGVRAVTLLGADLQRINGLSCAVMVLGMEKGRALIESTPGLEGLIVDADGSVWISAGLKTRLVELKGRSAR